MVLGELGYHVIYHKTPAGRTSGGFSFQRHLNIDDLSSLKAALLNQMVQFFEPYENQTKKLWKK